MDAPAFDICIDPLLLDDAFTGSSEFDRWLAKEFLEEGHGLSSSQQQHHLSQPGAELFQQPCLAPFSAASQHTQQQPLPHHLHHQQQHSQPLAAPLSTTCHQQQLQQQQVQSLPQQPALQQQRQAWPFMQQTHMLPSQQPQPAAFASQGPALAAASPADIAPGMLGFVPPNSNFSAAAAMYAAPEAAATFAAAAAPYGRQGSQLAQGGQANSVLKPALYAVPGPGGMLVLAASPADAAAMAAAAAMQQQQQLSSGSKMVGSAGGARRGRGRTNAPAVPGMEKPKGPSTRFRERQRETISNLEAEVTEKLAQLRALSAENEVLKLRSAVLEAAVKGREYHFKVVKEHGPPVFVADQPDKQSHAAMHRFGSCHSGAAWPSGASGCMSGSAAATSNSQQTATQSSLHGPGMTAGSAGTVTDGETSSPRAVVVAAGAPVLQPCQLSGVKPEPVGTSDGAPAGSGDLMLPADDLLPADSSGTEDAVQHRHSSTPAMDLQEFSTIQSYKHVAAEDIIQRWKQFLQDVTEELLQADQEIQAEKLRRLASGESDAAEEEASLISAAETVSSVCRWCSCCNSGQHSAEGCTDAAASVAAGSPVGDPSRPVRKAAAVPVASSASALPGVPASARQPTASEHRITELVNKYSYETKFVALLNPGVLYNLMGRNLDTGLPESYSDAHWRHVVQQLGLSKHQVTHILACAELYFGSLSKLLAERKALQEQLQGPEDPQACCAARLSGPDGTVNQLQVLDKLASNLKREHVLRIMLNCFVWGRSLNCIQFAKSAVYSHPFFPDVHAMVCVIYEDACAKSPDGQPLKIFAHRSKSTVLDQQQQDPAQLQQLQALHEQLRGQSEELRAQSLAQQQQQQQQEERMLPEQGFAALLTAEQPPHQFPVAVGF